MKVVWTVKVETVVWEMKLLIRNLTSVGSVNSKLNWDW